MCPALYSFTSQCSSSLKVTPQISRDATLAVTNEILDEVRELSGIMTVGCTFLTPAVQQECERVVPDLNAINPQDAADHYIFLKTHFVEPIETVAT